MPLLVRSLANATGAARFHGCGTRRNVRFGTKPSGAINLSLDREYLSGNTQDCQLKTGGDGGRTAMGSLMATAPQADTATLDRPCCLIVEDQTLIAMSLEA